MADIVRAFRVTGRVQGVWFRGWTRETALTLGLRGWVRNEEDGSVSGVVAGPEGAVDRMLAALEEGPPAARVDQVSQGQDAADPSSGFMIRR